MSIDALTFKLISESYKPNELFELVDAMSEIGTEIADRKSRDSGFITAVNVQKFVKNLSNTVKTRQSVSNFCDSDVVFSKTASKFGHLINCLEKGSSFGEEGIH